MSIKEFEFQDITSGAILSPIIPVDIKVTAIKPLVIKLDGNAPGVQGLEKNLIIEDFELIHDALIFGHLKGTSLSDLDNNVESVTDTGNSLVFNFMGGGSLTLQGISGYSDFTSLSIDYYIEIQ